MRRRLTLAQQAFGLRGRFSDAYVQFDPPGLVCVVDLEPTPLSRSYTVRIEYNGYSRPVVKVLAPPLEGIPGQELPHTFKDGDLCLHLHEEWGPEDLITTTIIPWTSEWLLHYEIWRASGGTWCGGGHEPELEANVERAEVLKNYAAFEAMRAELEANHLGKFAVLHDGQLVGTYASIREARTAGNAHCGVGNFTTQEIRSEPIELGRTAAALA